MTTKSKKRKPTCPNWQILLGEYVLGTIAERDRARLERHLARCRRCRRALAETENMYRLMGDFDLAKAGPFFAAEVDRAIKGAAPEAEAAESPAKTRAGLWGWLRAPAFISAAAAAAAIVIGVLFVKVWLPGVSNQVGETGIPAEAPPAASVGKTEKVAEAAGEKAGAVSERRAEAPASTLEVTEEALPEPRVADEFTTYDAAVAAAPPEGGRPAPAPYSAEGEDEARSAEEPIADFDALMRREAAGAGAGFGAARGYARADAGVVVYGPPGAVALTATDVEGWMDPRFEADVERLTGDDGALLDYVTPNGLLMAYFYELPVEEQRMLLSRMRREAEETPATEMLLSH